MLIAKSWLWWLKIDRSKYPVLFGIIIEFLFITSTRCGYERCFSTAGLTITSDWNSLQISTAEAIQLLKKWIKDRVVGSFFIECSIKIKWRVREQIVVESASPDFNSLWFASETYANLLSLWIVAIIPYNTYTKLLQWFTVVVQFIIHEPGQDKRWYHNLPQRWLV